MDEICTEHTCLILSSEQQGHQQATLKRLKLELIATDRDELRTDGCVRRVEGDVLRELLCSETAPPDVALLFKLLDLNSDRVGR